MVLIDTNIWSLVLWHPRGRDLPMQQQENRRAALQLMEEGDAVLIAPIRQELLTGVRYGAQFERLRGRLDAFNLLPLKLADYDRAAEFANICADKGISSDPVDMLICSICFIRLTPVLTMDRDFLRYARHLPIRLYEP